MCESQHGEQGLPVLVVAPELAILVEGEGVVVETLIPHRVPDPMFPGGNASDKVGDVFCDVCLLYSTVVINICFAVLAEHF